MSRGIVNSSRRVSLCKVLCLIGVLVLFVWASGEAQPASSPWPMAQQNATRTSAATVTGPAVGQLSWTLSELQIGPISRSPVIGPDGTIYVGSDNGLLYAVSPEGLILWSFDPQPCVTPPCNPTGLSAPAVAADGTIYVAFGVHVNEGGEGQGGLVAVSPNGTELWRYTQPASAIGLFFFSYTAQDPLIGPDGVIYFSLSSMGCSKKGVPPPPGCPLQNTFYAGFVAAISPTGAGLWYTRLEAPTAPALVGNTLYVGYTTHRWHVSPPPIPWLETHAHPIALNASTGETLWDNDLGMHTAFVYSPAVGPDGTIYIGDIWSGMFYAFNPDGTEKWSLDLSPGDGFTSTPAVGPDGTLYVTHVESNLYSCSLVAIQDSGTSGVPLWTLTLVESNFGGPPVVPAVDASGVIYIGTSSIVDENEVFKLLAVNPDGTVKWEVELPGYAGSPPALQQNFVYVGGSLYAIGLAPPAITLQKTAVDLNGLPLKQGNVIEYTIVITNNGGPHGDNPGHEFEDRIPTNTLYVEGSASASAGTISFEPSTSQIVWDGSLEPGASVTLKFQVRVMRRGGLGPLSQAPFWGSFVAAGLIIGALGFRNRRALLIGLLLIASLFAFNACTVTPIHVCNQGTFHMDTDGDGLSDTNVLTDDPTTSASPDATCL